MQYPKFLRPSDKIAIVSPAGGIRPEFVDAAAATIAANGFEPVEMPSCRNRYRQFAGTDNQRLADLQQALNRNDIVAIWCSRGGYGMIKIIDKIDFCQFSKRPKWIIGFSDITNLHLAASRHNVASIHGLMAKACYENRANPAVGDIFRLLKGEKLLYCEPAVPQNRRGHAQAELTGGNLSTIYSLQATDFEIVTNGKILFIEDLNEYLYLVDRIMNNLRMSGKLKHLAGLIVGAFTDMKDNETPFGKDINEIVYDYVADYDYPVCFNFPVGHIPDNRPLVSGGKYDLRVDNDVCLQLL